jgi:CHAT domain-containing protein/tetratricopeptide (TPR) repeat protein
LERATDDHLTQAELDLVLSSGSGLPSGSPAQDSTGVFAHLSACPRCRAHADRQLKAQAALDQLKVEETGPRGPDCPSEDELQKCAAGALSMEQSEHCLHHAVTCDHCGPLLKNAAEIFADELTREQTALVSRLESSKVLWQSKLAQRLGQTVRRPIAEGTRAGFFSSSSRAAIFVASAVILCIIGLRIFQYRAPNEADEVSKLLDHAYTERRLTDLRLFGAAYGPMVVRRGSGESSSLDRPAPLLEAEARIAREIRKHPNDVRWQVAKARADLVEGNLYEAAVDTLERILESTPDDAVRLDLASAYFQLAQATNQPAAYGKAANLLGEVLSKNPHNPVARFNRAIVLERLYLYQQAEEDWKRYLELDSGSAWAEEARSRQAALREKIEQQRNHSSSPLLTPGEFWAKYQTAIPEDLAALDRDIESYRDAALQAWLIQAFPRTIGDPAESSAARKGLQALARILLKQHEDSWLTDLLEGVAHDPQFSKTATWISESYRADAAGDYGKVEALARQAERRNQTAQNEAVQIEAQWQLLFANRLSLRTQACLAIAKRLWREVDVTPYQWLRVRILLDYSQCADHNNQVQLSKKLNDRCLRLSAKYGFPDLFLRATKVSADLALQTEDAPASMTRALGGLQAFWGGGFSYMSGYNLLTTVDDAAEFEELWHLDANVIAEALGLLGNDPDVGMRAVEQERLANALLLSGDLSGANENLTQARALLSTLPDDDANRRKLAEIEVEVAKLDLLRGVPDDALARLRTIRREVLQASDDYLSFDFFVAYGKALRLSGASPEAEEALSSAVRIAEKGLRNLQREHDRLRWSRRCSTAYREIVRLEVDRDPSAAFSLWETFKAASLAQFARAPLAVVQSSLRQTSPSATGQGALRSLLRPGAAAVSYAVLDDGVSVWVYDGDSISQQWISTSAENIERLSRSFAADCANPKSDLAATQREGRELYRILFEPVARLLSSRASLVIEPDGFLEQIPFAALQDGQGIYLGDRFSLSASPGLDYLRGSSPVVLFSRDSRALVVADTSSHPEFGVPELPGAEAEARWVASGFSHPGLLLREQATPLLVAKDLPAAELFHFAGHAVVSASVAGLVLYGGTGEQRDRVLTAMDISKNAVSRLRLVVLSACATAKGRHGGFSDAESLARSLVAEGVGQVVASRWPVDSGSTTVLMQDFYRHLMRGEMTTDSLRAAQKELRDKEGFPHPFYWAAFSVFGNV